MIQVSCKGNFLRLSALLPLSLLTGAYAITGCASRQFNSTRLSSQEEKNLDSVRKVISTGGRITPLFTWFSRDDERGAALAANPSQTLPGKLKSHWKRIQKGPTAAYDAQGGAGIYFAEDPFTSYEYGNTLLITFTPAQELKVIDYFGPGVDDVDKAPPQVLNAAISEDHPAFRYTFSGWFGGKAVVVRKAEFLDLAPGRQIVIHRPAEARSLTQLDAKKLRALVGKPFFEILPEIIDQSETLEHMHRMMFPETDHHTMKPDAPVLSREGALTDFGVLYYALKVLSRPPEELKKRFYDNVNSLGKCGQAYLPQCVSSLQNFLKKGQGSYIPTEEFAAMLKLLGFISNDASPKTAEEFQTAIVSQYGAQMRPVIEALAALLLDMHKQIAPNAVSVW